MSSLLAKVIVNAFYWSPFNPKSSELPDDGLREMVEGPDQLPPGRALDLGCGRGRNSIYLAGRGWDVTGIDLVGHAVAEAKHKAAEAGVSPRLEKGDATELDRLGVPPGQTLIVDAGCFHGLPNYMRERYVTAVNRVAAPGASLLMLGLSRHPLLKGLTPRDLGRWFHGWKIVSAEHITGTEMLRYGDGVALHQAFERGWFQPWRYRLEREAAAA